LLTLTKYISWCIQLNLLDVVGVCAFFYTWSKVEKFDLG